MASHENTSAAIENALNAAQVLFTANPLFLPPQAKATLQAQERIFNELEKFSSSWFQRRQEAAQSLIDTGRRIASESAGNPAKTFKELTEWQTRYIQNFALDAKDCTEMLTRCARAFSTSEADTQR